MTIDGYVVDVLLPDLIGHDKRPAAFALYLFLYSTTRAAGRDSAHLSYATLADRTGLSKSAMQRAAAWLVKRHLIKVRTRSRTATPEYTVLTPWKR
jgi:DNA-binding MarR family transcriptional regulator